MWRRSKTLESPARNWYTLTNADINAKELPTYGKAIRVRIGSGVTLPVVLEVVPVGEPDDNKVQTLQVDATETLPFGVRRVVTINGGATIPANVGVRIITE